MKPVTDMMARIDALSVRERGAVFIAILAVIFFVWDSYLMTSLSEKENFLGTQLQQKQAEQASLNAELQVLIGKNQEDPNVRNKERLESLRRQLEEVRAEVLESTKHLIEPKRMAAVLENVLIRTRGLELIKVKGLGSTALVADGMQGEKQADKASQSSKQGTRKTGKDESLASAYKHGLKIVFNGSYMATLEYVKELETLESEFLWENLQLKVTDYPDAEASITVYTLSLDKNWIGA